MLRPFGERVALENEESQIHAHFAELPLALTGVRSGMGAGGIVECGGSEWKTPGGYVPLQHQTNTPKTHGRFTILT